MVRAYRECMRQIQLKVDEWMRRWIDNDAIKETAPTSPARLTDLKNTLELFCAPNAQSELVPPDLEILAQVVAIDADFIVTNNFRSIDHGALNGWARREEGKNRNLIGDLAELSDRTVPSYAELQIIGAMTASESKRSIDEERRSIDLFIQNLFALRHNRLASRIFDQWTEIREESKDLELIDESRQLSATESFKQARLMNAQLLDISRDATTHWQELMSQNDIDHSQERGRSHDNL